MLTQRSALFVVAGHAFSTPSFLICNRGSLRAIGLTLTACQISQRLAPVHVSVCLVT